MNQVLARCLRAGCHVDSPVKIQVARKLARCAPPYTQGPGEEPWEGGYLATVMLFGISRWVGFVFEVCNCLSEGIKGIGFL